mgnify:CR=1 FL=1
MSCREKIKVLNENLEEIRQLAFYDTLTNLPNRNLFSDRLTILEKQPPRQQTTNKRQR